MSPFSVCVLHKVLLGSSVLSLHTFSQAMLLRLVAEMTKHMLMAPESKSSIHKALP